MDSLRLETLTKRFGGLDAVSDLTVAFERGQITGLIGPNGAGKTTVVNMITGIVVPSDGDIWLGARSLTRIQPHEAARLGIARTFQNVRLLTEESVLDNVVQGFHRHQRSSLLANSIGLPLVWREKSDFRARARALIERFGMSELADRAAGALSYGHRRLVEIMRALALTPSFLLLDEPCAGMNDVESRKLGLIIRELAKEGIGIVLVEHNMRFVMEFCDHIFVVDSGRLIAEGGPEAVRNDANVIRAYLGS
jgi:branched-chain amino acid transport system ATP-binding protein